MPGAPRQPDWPGFAVAKASGTEASYLTLLAAPSLVGVQLDHEMLPFQLGAAGAFTDITAGNSLRLTLGRLRAPHEPAQRSGQTCPSHGGPA